MREKFEIDGETVEAVQWDGRMGLLCYLYKKWFPKDHKTGLNLRLADKGKVAVKPGMWIVKTRRGFQVMTAEEFFTAAGKNDERIGILREMRGLAVDIEEHNTRYYELFQPEISDQDYDMLVKRLEQLEREYPDMADPNSPTQRVGSDLG